MWLQAKPGQGYYGVDRGKSARLGIGSVGLQAELRRWGERPYFKLDGEVMWKGEGSERLWAEPEKRV